MAPLDVELVIKFTTYFNGEVSDSIYVGKQNTGNFQSLSCSWMMGESHHTWWSQDQAETQHTQPSLVFWFNKAVQKFYASM